MWMNQDMLNDILNKFKNRDDIYFGDMDISEEQKAYIQGYLTCISEKNECDRNGSNTNDIQIQKEINKVRSKYCEPILNLLAEEGNLYHGDLAEKLELSPSGLNAIIKKLQEAAIPLIETSQIGKYKIYSLTEPLKEYMMKKGKRGLKDATEKNADDSVGVAEREENLFVQMQFFIDVSGKEWKKVFCLLLQGDETDDYEVEKSFEQLMELAVLKRKKNDILKFRDFLDNDVLLYLFDDFIEAKTKCKEKVYELLENNENKRDIKLLSQELERMIE